MLSPGHLEHGAGTGIGRTVQEQVPAPPENLVPGQLLADRRHVPVTVKRLVGPVHGFLKRCTNLPVQPVLQLAEARHKPDAVVSGSQRMNGNIPLRNPLRIFSPRRSIDILPWRASLSRHLGVGKLPIT